MGANPWHYLVPYQGDINTTLQALREQEFRAGRYGFSAWLIKFHGTLETSDDPRANTIASALSHQLSAILNTAPPPTPASAADLIAIHGSVEAAIRAVFAESEADGTSSILDMFGVAETPEPGAVAPLPSHTLRHFFGTEHPTRAIVEPILLGQENSDISEEFWSDIGRGEGRYILLYEDSEPSKPGAVFFAGYSFD